MNIFQNELSSAIVHSSKLKVKLFIQNSVEGMEEKINEWMEENDINICQISQSQSEKMGRFIFVFTILYSTKD